MPSKYIIHTVGPVYAKTKADEKREQLQSAYRRSLEEAVTIKDNDGGVKSIAFPSISTGVYGYPIDDATDVAIETVLEFLQGDNSLESVVFCTFSEEDHDVYLERLPHHLAEPKEHDA